MELPPLFHEFRNLPPNLQNARKVVCKLRCSLYGTKQGAHNWYSEVVKIFVKLGFTVSNADEVLFFRIQGEQFTLVGVATDDFTIVADSDGTVNAFKRELKEFWKFSDLGPINWLLGVSISCDLQNRTISLSQESFIEQIIIQFGLEDCRSAVTPLEPGIDLTPDSHSTSPTLLTPSEKTQYCEMIGSLMYTTVMTRPDIAFAVSTLSQYLEALCSTHMKAVTRVFQYLAGTKGLKLVLEGNNNVVSGYSDADWVSHLHRHSISGFIYFIGDGIVLWSCKKQPIITLSSTEAEYVALTHSSKDILWIHKILLELSLVFDFIIPTTLFCDNQGAIRLLKDSTFHG